LRSDGKFQKQPLVIDNGKGRKQQQQQQQQKR